MRLILICLLLMADASFAKEASYLLPHGHPLKKKIDHIFQGSKQPLKNASHLKRAGFDSAAPQKRTQIVVTTHPKLPGYIFKLYTDDQEMGKRGFEKLVARIEGINIVRRAIQEKQKGHLFKVPYKWLYKLKDQGTYILVEEKMDLDPAHFALWKDPLKVTPELLREVYSLATFVGYNDGLSPDNLPFCLDGKIAIIDSERVGKWPVRYGSLTRYLPPELQSYWIELVTK